MAAVASAELVAEIEATAESGPPEGRARMLQQIAGLFVAGANRLQPQQVGPFDDVLVRLIEQRLAHHEASAVTPPSPSEKEKTHNTPARIEVSR